MSRAMQLMSVVFGLVVLYAPISGAVKCHLCDTYSDEDCKTENGRKMTKEATECDMYNMYKQSNFFRNYPHLENLFKIDNPQSQVNSPDHHLSMACSKVDLVVDGKEVTVRSCQSAKTDKINPCTVMEGTINQLNKDKNRGTTMIKYCDLCMTDACNGSEHLTSSKFGILMISLLGAFVLGAFRGEA